ncbi:MAG TPA: hypothetical protein VGK67_35530 [Myxococcales bacterium]
MFEIPSGFIAVAALVCGGLLLIAGVRGRGVRSATRARVSPARPFAAGNGGRT